MLTLFKHKIIRKIFRPIKEGECWRIGKNMHIKDVLQGANVVKFIVTPTKMVW
jgi:hypothetical protein